MMRQSSGNEQVRCTRLTGHGEAGGAIVARVGVRVVDKLVCLLSAAMSVSVDGMGHGLRGPVQLVRLGGVADEGNGRCLCPLVSF